MKEEELKSLESILFKERKEKQLIIWLQEVVKNKNRFLPLEGAMPVGISTTRYISIGRARGEKYDEECYPIKVIETTGKEIILPSVYLRSGRRGYISFPIKRLKMVGDRKMSTNQVEIYLRKGKEKRVEIVIENVGGGRIEVYDKGGRKIGSIDYREEIIVDEDILYLQFPGAYFLMGYPNSPKAKRRAFLKIYVVGFFADLI